MKFNTVVRGISCVCNVLSYRPFTPGKYHLAPENCYPDEDSEFEFELLNKREKHIAWLEKKMTKDDEIRLESEYLDIIDQF